MKFSKTIFVMSIICIASGCSDKVEFHNIQNLIDNNKIVIGTKPFAHKNIHKICILVSGASIGEYLDSDKFVPYGYMAIIEYQLKSNYIGYLREGALRYHFPLNAGTGYCTKDVKKLFINKIGKNWVLVMEN